MKRLAAVIVVAVTVSGAAPAIAAATSPPKAATQAPAPVPPAEPSSPYEPQLLRLAELTGALAYLRDLCGAGDGTNFRAKMAKLLESEGFSDSKRDLLAGAYNRGFRDYQTTYRSCTPVASQVISRLLSEAARLAAELASRFGT